MGLIPQLPYGHFYGEIIFRRLHIGGKSYRFLQHGAYVESPYPVGEESARQKRKILFPREFIIHHHFYRIIPRYFFGRIYRESFHKIFPIPFEPEFSGGRRPHIQRHSFLEMLKGTVNHQILEPSLLIEKSRKLSM